MVFPRVPPSPSRAHALLIWIRTHALLRSPPRPARHAAVRWNRAPAAATHCGKASHARPGRSPGAKPLGDPATPPTVPTVQPTAGVDPAGGLRLGGLGRESGRGSGRGRGGSYRGEMLTRVSIWGDGRASGRSPPVCEHLGDMAPRTRAGARARERERERARTSRSTMTRGDGKPKKNKMAISLFGSRGGTGRWSRCRSSMRSRECRSSNRASDR